MNKTTAAPLHLNLEQKQKESIWYKARSVVRDFKGTLACVPSLVWEGVKSGCKRLGGILMGDIWSKMHWVTKWMVLSAFSFLLGAGIWVGYDLVVMANPMIGGMVSVKASVGMAVTALWLGPFLGFFGYGITRD